MTQPKSLRAILFDVDGTLVDTNDLHASAWHEAFAHFGHELPYSDVRWQIGKGGDNLIPALLPELSDEQRNEIEDFRSDLFHRNYLSRATVFPGVRMLFERLYADGIGIILASSSDAEEVDFYRSLIGAGDLVTASTSKDDVERSKPCPDIFEAATKKAAPAEASELLVIGDTPWDADAAMAAGLEMVGVRCGGFPDDALRDAGAATLFDGPQDLLDRYDEWAADRG
jgi:HAD superfamily hydrolase (TIGR01509 family)